MSSRAYCCDDCFALIARKNTPAAKLWLDMCNTYQESGTFVLVNEDHSATILEEMGFITSTETKNFILVRVNGILSDGTETYFCGGNCGS